MRPLAYCDEFKVYDKRIDEYEGSKTYFTNLVRIDKPPKEFLDIFPCWINIKFFEKK